MRYVLLYILTVLLLWSCSSTKYVPEGKYLLNSVDIKADNKDIDAVLLEDFVRQNPNSSLPLLGKVRLRAYSAAGDTSKSISRFMQKIIGQEPVIFNARLADVSATQMRKQLWNQGYLNSKVDTLMNIKGKKLDLTYDVKSGTPYRIRNYELKIVDNDIKRILAYSKRFSNLRKGMLFDQEAIDLERTRMTSILRNFGYYSLSKTNWHTEADTTLNSHQADLFLSLRQSVDSVSFKRYRFRNVTVVSGFDITNDANKDIFSNPDTIYKQGVLVVHGKNNFLRNSMILKNNYIKPGNFFSDRALSSTYSAFNGTGAVKQTNIRLTPVYKDSLSFLDASITLVPGNLHWFEAGLDGTNSAGDIGVAPSVAYKHQNIFNGAELLSVKLKGAYEFITGEKSSELGKKSFYEYGIETSISFPQFLFPWLKQSWRELPTASTQMSLGLTNQHRSEYTRQFFNATYTFRWSMNRGQYAHALDLFDINYVRMPWMSDVFKETLDKNKVLKATYDNQLISRMAYNLTYTKSQGGRITRDTYIIRTGVDAAGLLPRLVTTINNPAKNSDGRYEIMGIAYAEYLKADFSFAHTRKFDRQSSFAYHIGFGVASPYGNSDILPYERRYFSGGANSVRGWSSRRLGPGSYQKNDSTTFINQVGDIKLDLSVEYRRKMGEFFELAGFVDAGNVWTIRNYVGQEGGVFKFNKFYKEIALAYGLGIRFDLSFLLLRLDFGMKAYDPSRNEGDRFIMFKPNLSRDAAIHFAIGYPF